MATKSKFAQSVPPVAAKKTVVKPVAIKSRRNQATVDNIVAAGAKVEMGEPVITHTEHTPLDRLRAAWDDYTAWLEQPTWARRVTSVALGLLTYGGVFYMGLQLVDVLVAGAMLYTGVGFISFMAAFLGLCAALVAATTVGVYVYEFAMAFDASRVRERFNSFADSVKARFISQPLEVPNA